MRLTISKTGPPLNHRLWTLVYLICFLLGFCIQGRGEATQTVKPIQRIEYHWKILENYIQIMRTRKLLYGKTQGKEKKTQSVTEVSEPQPSPSQAGFEIQTRGRCNRRQPQQHLVAQNLPARRLAHAIWRQDARRSYPATPQSPSGQRTMYGPAGALSVGGTA
jgi:hypothetical protein